MVSLTLAVLMPLGAAMVALAGPASANVTAVKGSAYGYRTEVSLFGGPTGIRGYGQYVCTGGTPSNPTPAGCVSSTGPGNFAEAASPSVLLPTSGSAPITDSKPTGAVGRYGPGIIFSAANLSVSTEGTTGSSGSVTSSSHITGVPTTTVGEIIYAGTIDSTCTTSETSSGGSASFAGPGDALATNQGIPQPNPPNPAPAYPTLRTSDGNPDVDGDETYYQIPTSPAPNTTVHGTLEAVGDTFTVIFNEQIVNPDGSITINAAHEILEGPTAIGHGYIGHVECGVARTTTTTVTSSVNPSVSGQPLSFTATVARTAGTGTPVGTVQFKVDGVNSGAPVTLNAGGTATSAANSSLSVGSHTVQAVYSGSGAFTGSTGTLTQTVSKAATTTAVASSANPAGLLTTVTFTATVSPVAPGAGTRTGTVQFTDNGANLGSPVAVDASGNASTSSLGVSLGLGAHTITAVYSGDSKFTGSTSPVLNQTVGVV